LGFSLVFSLLLFSKFNAFSGILNSECSFFVLLVSIIFPSYYLKVINIINAWEEEALKILLGERGNFGKSDGGGERGW
jgi:hypothetical protein